MEWNELTSREQQVFLAIVHGFIQTAEPVGSRFLSKYFDLNISPATIRNVMSDLEEKGLIWQPHTSAGRMPTTTGYRKYVDTLDLGLMLSDEEKNSIIEKLDYFSKDVDLIITKAAHVLSEISNQLGVVLSPRFNRGRLDKIELVHLSGQKILVILSVKSGLVKTVLVEIESEISSDFIYATAQLINERLHNISIAQLTEYFNNYFNDVDEQKKILLNAIKEKTDVIFKFEPDSDFHFSGARNVIFQPEFGTREKVGKILELLDRKDVLVRVLSEHNSEGVSIVIGEENTEELMQNCSLITTSYSIDNAIGTLGIIGPTRMQYAKMISLVKFMAETLNYLMCKKN